MTHTNTLAVPVGTPVMICGVPSYDGSTGLITGTTQMLPPWYIVQLESGQRVVVQPGHLIARKEQNT